MIKLAKSISLFFPAYNEEKNIEQAVARAKAVLSKLTDKYEIIVIDDGSGDKTGEIADRLACEDSHVKVVHHPYNVGYGAALWSGIKNSHNELVFFTDADLQFDIGELTKLMPFIDDYGIVTGRRGKRRDPWYRKANAWGWGVLVRRLFGLKVRDIDCAFKLFRKEALDKIDLEAKGAMINTEILVQAQKAGYQIKEVAVEHYPRQTGRQTGNSPKVVARAFWELIKMYRRLKSSSN